MCHQLADSFSNALDKSTPQESHASRPFIQMHTWTNSSYVWLLSTCFSEKILLRFITGAAHGAKIPQLTPQVTDTYSQHVLYFQLSVLIYVFILTRLIYKQFLLKKNKSIGERVELQNLCLSFKLTQVILHCFIYVF